MRVYTVYNKHTIRWTSRELLRACFQKQFVLVDNVVVFDQRRNFFVKNKFEAGPLPDCLTGCCIIYEDGLMIAYGCFIQVFFLPMSSTIMMCFKDDSIFAWDSETMQSLYHLHVPTPGEKSLGFKAFAVSKCVTTVFLLVMVNEVRIFHFKTTQKTVQKRFYISKTVWSKSMFTLLTLQILIVKASKPTVTYMCWSVLFQLWFISYSYNYN